jgi:predicted nucleic acid-binding protein
VAAYYVDTSALVKLHVAERGTAWMTALTDPVAGHTLRTVRLTGVELIATLTRLARGGVIPPGRAANAVAGFRLDWRRRYEIVDADERIVNLAMDMAERHGLRGYDAVHLAAALAVHRQRQADGLEPLTFISADTEQLRAAVAEGLLVDDPNQHP